MSKFKQFMEDPDGGGLLLGLLFLVALICIAIWFNNTFELRHVGIRDTKTIMEVQHGFQSNT